MPETGIVAKWPTALAVDADVGGPMDNFAQLVLAGPHTNVTLAIVVTTAIPVGWPATGYLSIDREIMQYASFAGSTFTIADLAHRGMQNTVAVAHADQAPVGRFMTEQEINQMFSEVKAIEAYLGIVGSGLTPQMPNLAQNGDFGRRTLFELVHTEVFGDLTGLTKLDAGAAAAVAANIMTQGAANNEYASCAGAFVWRDGRVSATFKATAIAGVYQAKFRQDANTWLSVKQNNGNFTITSSVANADVVRATIAAVLTLNRWYWIELEVQGNVIIGKLYDTLGTVPGVTKAASTLVQTVAFVGTNLLTGAATSITSDQAAAQWGGIAASPGGFYTETFGAESGPVVFAGTLGGLAWGLDDAADSGPIGKQWAGTVFVPAITRQMTQDFTIPWLPPLTPVSFSHFIKCSGLGGAGTMIRLSLIEKSSAGAVLATTVLDDAGELVYTRKTSTVTTQATTSNAVLRVSINAASTRTGTVRYSCIQLEVGSVPTYWRNAPEDGAPIFIELNNISGGKSTAAGIYGDVDPRDSAHNIFLPWDADVEAFVQAVFSSNTLAAVTVYNLFVDGADWEPAAGGIFQEYAPGVNYSVPLTLRARKRLAAGKHRISLRWKVTAGTTTQYADATAGAPTIMGFIASRGR